MTTATILMIVILTALTATNVFLFRQLKILEHKMEHIQSQTISLAEKLGGLKSRLDERPAVGADIEQQIAEAKDRIFTEWIQNIANYTPYGQGDN